MILAAADCADGKGPPPGELTLGWQAQRWGALPEAGGLKDQPAGLLEKMSTCVSIYDAMRAHKACPPGQEGEFSRRNPDAWRIWLSVLEMRRGN